MVGMKGSNKYFRRRSIQITNSSLQDIQAALGATLEEGSWISTSYLVAEIVVIPLTGWLSQVFSIRRKIYLLIDSWIGNTW